VKRDKILKTIEGVVEKYGNAVTAAYLFGSRAKEEAGSLGDIDVAVLFSKKASGLLHELKFKVYADLCRSFNRNDIDLLILNNASNLIIQDEIVRHGIVIHDRDPEAREEFEVRVIHSCIDFKTQRQNVVGH